MVHSNPQFDLGTLMEVEKPKTARAPRKPTQKQVAKRKIEVRNYEQGLMGGEGELNIAPNTLMQGDNLPFLRAINTNTIDLIATDPPFNKGRDFNATPESLAAGASFKDRWNWKEDIHQEWIDEIKNDWPALWEVIDAARHTWGEDMGAFLCYMAVRVLEMHRILKPTGSLYLHCDSTASAYLKIMLDAIFNRKNFRNEIAWCYTGPSNTKRWFPRKHDTILFYVKDSDSSVFNTDDIRVPYKDGIINKAKGSGSKVIWSEGHNEERIKELSNLGKIPEDWWDDFSPVGRIKSENLGYPTQKPLALYRRIIEASSNPGQVVLDPFCGCATTLVAAQQLNRKWIGIDLWPTSLELVENRLGNECPMFTGGISEMKSPPQRTDDGEFAAPPLKSKVKERTPIPPGEDLPREEMIEKLFEEQAGKCKGCDIVLPVYYFELDHKLARSEGGHNGISNRQLLCGPCNKTKSDTLATKGLRRKNEELGRMQ